MNFLGLIITVPLTVFAVLFAVSNGGEVRVSLWPLEQIFVTRASILGLVMMALGFFAGAVLVALQAQKTRFAFWRERRKTMRLEKQIENAQNKEKEAASFREPA